MTNSAENYDYLAYFPIGSGSSWGWGSTTHEAIGHCIIGLKDWSDYYVINNKELKCQVFFMPNSDGFVADDKGVFSTDMKGLRRFPDAPEEAMFIATFTTPKNKRYSRESALWSALMCEVKQI